MGWVWNCVGPRALWCSLLNNKYRFSLAVKIDFVCQIRKCRSLQASSKPSKTNSAFETKPMINTNRFFIPKSRKDNYSIPIILYSIQLCLQNQVRIWFANFGQISKLRKQTFWNWWTTRGVQQKQFRNWNWERQTKWWAWDFQPKGLLFVSLRNCVRSFVSFCVWVLMLLDSFCKTLIHFIISY